MICFAEVFSVEFAASTTAASNPQEEFDAMINEAKGQKKDSLQTKVPQQKVDSWACKTTKQPGTVIATSSSFITKTAQISCFLPGLTHFQNKWYLTAIEDSGSVLLQPRFLPQSQFDVRTCEKYMWCHYRLLHVIFVCSFYIKCGNSCSPLCSV